MMRDYFGHDDEVPAGFQDADIEMRELENRAAENAAAVLLRIAIGARVRCNKGFAAAFEGLTGTIIGARVDAFGKMLYTVKFDKPTAPARNWPICDTLAAGAECFEVLK